MEYVFGIFKEAQAEGSGPLLATAITPAEPATSPAQLRQFANSTNVFSVASDVRYYLLQDKATKTSLPKPEANAWIDIFVAYWKFAVQYLKVESSDEDGSYVKIFEAWKDVSTALIKGYTGGGFQAWTVPCLYIAGKYLRVFATKADDQQRKKGSMEYNNNFQDDVTDALDQNKNLEEAARVINRIFQICISDRYLASLYLQIVLKLGTAAESALGLL